MVFANVAPVTEAVLMALCSSDLLQAGATGEIQQSLACWSLLPRAGTISPNTAAEAYRQQLSRALEAENQNRIFSKSDATDGRWFAALQQAPWDSQFFGFKTAKLEPITCLSQDFAEQHLAAGNDLLDQCLGYARSFSVDHISARVHARDVAIQYVLQSNDFRLADTIAAYKLPLTDWTSSVKNDKSVRTARESDLSLLREISGICFSNRELNANRFVSDPQFPAALVKEMYELWIENSLSGKLADKVFVSTDQDRAVGFITASLIKSNNSAEITATIPLNAVHPDYHRQGRYKNLVIKALDWLKTEGANEVEIKTQLPNFGVHQCWQSLGAKLSSVFHTFHWHANGRG